MPIKAFLRDSLNINAKLRRYKLRMLTKSGYRSLTYPGFQEYRENFFGLLEQAHHPLTSQMNKLLDEVLSAVSKADPEKFFGKLIHDEEKRAPGLNAINLILSLFGAYITTEKGFNELQKHSRKDVNDFINELKDNGLALEEIRTSLADDPSKLAFDNLIRSRLTLQFYGEGTPSPFDLPISHEDMKDANRHLLDLEKKLVIEGPSCDERSFFLRTIWLLQQYHYQDYCEIAEGDTVFDIGGCYGETALLFAKSCGKHGRVYSFEPHEYFYNYLAINTKRHENIIPVKLGLDSQESSASVLSFNGKDCHAKLTTIDSFVFSNEIKKIDFIKMDIEGAERNAIEGGRAVLGRFRPKLAISVYHLVDDVRVITNIIRDIYGTDLSMYMKNVTNTYGETVLFVVPNRCKDIVK